jgi:hypothetical protein
MRIHARSASTTGKEKRRKSKNQNTSPGLINERQPTNFDGVEARKDAGAVAGCTALLRREGAPPRHEGERVARREQRHARHVVAAAATATAAAVAVAAAAKSFVAALEAVQRPRRLALRGGVAVVVAWLALELAR